MGVTRESSADPLVGTSPPYKADGAGGGSGDRGHIYDSQDDSGDELLDHNTVATLPLNAVSRHQPRVERPATPTRETQSTQVLDTPLPLRGGGAATPGTTVHVPASSPLPVHRASPVSRAPVPSVNSQAARVQFGSRIAPAGTAFRHPAIPIASQPVDLSDDDPEIAYSSDSSAERARAHAIKPAVFTRGSRVEKEQQQSQSQSQAKSGFSITNFLKRFEHQESSTPDRVPEPIRRSGIGMPLKRPADDMASAYGSSQRTPKAPRPTPPSPVSSSQARAMDLDDITDYSLRKKVEQICTIFPQHSVATIYGILLKKKGSYDDALLEVAELETIDMDLLTSPSTDDLTRGWREQDHSSSFGASQTAAAQRKRPVQHKSIAQKWSTTQRKPSSLLQQLEASQPASPPAKPRRRLVKGRRRASTPSSPVVEVEEEAQVISSDEDDEDQNVVSEEESEVDIGGSLLEYVNKATMEQLIDLSGLSKDVLETIVSHRPYHSLKQIRKVTDKPKAATKGKRGGRVQPVGDRFVDVCEDMWQGYRAVDKLVATCDKLGKPLQAQLKRWGFSTTPTDGGELSMTNFDDAHDSGIGTPSSTVSRVDDENAKKPGGSLPRLKKPAIMSSDFELKDYQVVGLNWMNLLYQSKLSGILADDMGLGKTCQVISFLSHLVESGNKGPHLVIVLSSTLENWLREFRTFSPELLVEPYHGSQTERAQLREDIIDSRDEVNVVVTTYDMAKGKDDSKFLRHLAPDVVVADEGHILKNASSQKHQALMRIPANFRLLLTGTPLQNNLMELIALLKFLMPEMFDEVEEDLRIIFKHKAKALEGDHAALLSKQRIDRARTMVTPFILRRKKAQVLKHLPKKIHKLEYCDLLEDGGQKEIYESLTAVGKDVFSLNADSDKEVGSKKSNVVSDLRKAAIHPLLFRRLYTTETLEEIAQTCIKDPMFQDSSPTAIMEELIAYSDWEVHDLCERFPTHLARFKLNNKEWMWGGKMTTLARLLTTFKANGDRTLVFSQFPNLTFGILSRVLNTLGLTYRQLDGSVNVSERQDMIDEFNTGGDGNSIDVFLLATKAGGVGVNLATANRVVILDPSFNPQEDVQAENRAHRVGQTRDVEVYRLITRGTVEEQIYRLGESKLRLDAEVAGEIVPAPDNGQSTSLGSTLELDTKSTPKAKTRGKKGSDVQSPADAEGEARVLDMLGEVLSPSATKTVRMDFGVGEDKEEPTTAATADGGGDMKDAFMTGLKNAGLNISAA